MNILDDPDVSFLVVRNDDGHYSIWPSCLTVPGGWSVIREADTRSASLDYVATTWTALNPGTAPAGIRDAGPTR
jgi:MbtH protein